MTSDRDIDRVLDQWFTERPTQVADRVFDEVADRIGRQPQQQAWRVLGRDSHMTSYLKPLLAVAAVVAIAVAGIAIFRQPSDSGVGGAATPAPSPSSTASASPAPSTSAVFPPWFTAQSDGAGILPAGNATTRRFVSGSTFSVPDGWVNDVDTSEFYRLFLDTPANEAEFALSEGPAQHIFMGIVDTPAVTPCEAVVVTQGSTAAELADSLVANEALVTSEPIDVTLGGLTGARVDAYVDPAWTGSCTGPEEPATKEAKDYRGRFIFLDGPNGRILIIVDSIHSADFEAFLAEAMPIIESFQFDVAP